MLVSKYYYLYHCDQVFTDPEIFRQTKKTKNSKKNILSEQFFLSWRMTKLSNATHIVSANRLI